MPERKYGERWQNGGMRPKGDEVRVTDLEGEAAEKLLHYSSFGTASTEYKIRHNAESIRCWKNI